MLNFNPEQTLKLLARRRRTRPDVARKPWEWSTPTPLPTPSSVAAETVEPQPPAASPGPNTNDGKTIDLTSPHVASYTFDDTQLRRNQRSIERHINDDHYVRSIAPGSLVLEGTAAHAIVNGRWGVLSLLDDGTSSAGFFTFERPSEWVTGKLLVTLRYSSPVGSASNFRIVLQAGVAKDGSVMAGTALPLSSINLLPGPAVANTRISFAVYSSSNVTREFDEISIRVQRTSGHVDDVNVNAFHVYGIRVEHVPGVLEVT